MNNYVIGSEVRVSVTFTVDDVLTDPTTVIGRVRINGGTIDVLTDDIVKVSTGSYYIDLQTNAVGRYAVRFEGTGDVVGVAETIFKVKESIVI